MKKFLVLGALCALVFTASSALFAGGVNMNTNMSAEFCKTLNRSASTDPDATFFNPAGTAFMADGFYLYLSDQLVFQPVSISQFSPSRPGMDYKGLKYAYYLPTGYLVFKTGQFSWSGGAMGIGGGGTGRFDQGLPMIDTLLSPITGIGKTINNVYSGLTNGLITNVIPGDAVIRSKFSGSSAIYGIQTSFAYAFLKDKLSMSLGYRLMIGSNSYKAKIYSFSSSQAYFGNLPLGTDFKSDQFGIAHGIIIGLSLKPVEDLTIGLRGEWNGPLRLKAKSKNDMIVGLVDSGMKNGGRTHSQVAANLNFGIAYKIQGLQIAGTFIYYFNQFAQLKGKEKNYVGGLEAGVGLDYTFKAVPLNIGIGYLFSTDGARPSARSQLDEAMDSHTASIGLTWKVNDMISLTLAQVYTYYVPVDVNKGNTSLKLFPAWYHKQSSDTAIGITAKVM